MTPSAVLIIQNGITRLVNVLDMDTVYTVLDFVPEAVNKISSLIKTRGKGDPEIEEVLNRELDESAKRTRLDD